MVELIKELKIFYDIIIFDTVSVLEGPEAEILSKICDLSLLIATYQKTSKEDLKKAYQILQNAEGSVIGTGLNRVPEGKIKKNEKIKKDTGKKYFMYSAKAIEETMKKIGKTIKKIVTYLSNFIKTRIKNLKEILSKYKMQKEEIKLIEAAREERAESNNIIKEVFESKMSQIEEETEREEILPIKEEVPIEDTLQDKAKEIEPMTINENESLVKDNINSPELVYEKIDEEPDMQENASKVEAIQEIKSESREETDSPKKRGRPHKKTNFELMLEQQYEYNKLMLEQKQKAENNEKKESKLTVKKMVDEPQNIKQNELDSEKVLQVQKEFSQNAMVDEEELRRQVELDELQRMAEVEEYQSNEIDHINQPKEKFAVFKNMFRSVQKWEAEKKEKAEIDKRKAKEEAKIQEELLEDNLYPRPKM